MLRDLCEAKGANFVAPDLNMSPEDAASLIWSEYEKAAVVGEVAVAGASLGGFYAAWLAGRTGRCVDPHDIFHRLGKKSRRVIGCNVFFCNKWKFHDVIQRLDILSLIHI
mgnify:CR=1 FL=1